MSTTQFCSPAEFASTTVTGAVLASDVSIPVASVAALKGNSTYPFYATFKNLELVKVTGDTAGASPITVIRGVDGTTAVAGVAGDSLEQNANAQNVKDLNAAVNALESQPGEVAANNASNLTTITDARVSTTSNIQISVVAPDANSQYVGNIVARSNGSFTVALSDPFPAVGTRILYAILSCLLLALFAPSVHAQATRTGSVIFSGATSGHDTLTVPATATGKSYNLEALTGGTFTGTTETLTPFTVSQNNLAVSATTAIVKMSCTGVVNLSGLSLGTNTDGRCITLTNTSSASGNVIIVEDENGGSSAGNQFYIPNATSIYMGPKSSTTWHYDGTISKWYYDSSN